MNVYIMLRGRRVTLLTTSAEPTLRRSHLRWTTKWTVATLSGWTNITFYRDADVHLDIMPMLQIIKIVLLTMLLCPTPAWRHRSCSSKLVVKCLHIGSARQSHHTRVKSLPIRYRCPEIFVAMPVLLGAEICIRQQTPSCRNCHRKFSGTRVNCTPCRHKQGLQSQRSDKQAIYTSNAFAIPPPIEPLIR